jgi:exosome complex exonuclease RRP6
MAALFKVLPSGPPVIRKRAKELLDVIRACITNHLSGVSVLPASTSQGSASVLTDEAEKMHPAPKVDAAPSSLWNLDQCQYTIPYVFRDGADSDLLIFH